MSKLSPIYFLHSASVVGRILLNKEGGGDGRRLRYVPIKKNAKPESLRLRKKSHDLGETVISRVERQETQQENKPKGENDIVVL